VLAAAATLSMAELAVERLPIWSGSNEVPMTLHYAGLFVVGMLLAREMPRLRGVFARMPFPGQGFAMPVRHCLLCP